MIVLLDYPFDGDADTPDNTVDESTPAGLIDRGERHDQSARLLGETCALTVG
jgi:hypothetical protein